MVAAETGYANSPDRAPTYRDVCNSSGHAETVKIVYDENRITLAELLDYYFTGQWKGCYLNNRKDKSLHEGSGQSNRYEGTLNNWQIIDFTPSVLSVVYPISFHDYGSDNVEIPITPFCLTFLWI